MKLTQEQLDIIEEVTNGTNHLIAINAVAGSGKTSTLVECSKAVGGEQLYLSYNKALAVEATTKFSQNVTVKTTHGLSYAPIVIRGLSMPGIKSGKRKVGFFNFRNITEPILYDTKILIIQTIEEYFLSQYVSLVEFLAMKKLDPSVSAYVIKYVGAMAKKEIECTHAFYLKYYHILLARNVIQPKELDLIMLDECADVNGVTLEIFKLYPAKKKIMVGDDKQNLYAFNGTINGFDKMKNESKNFTLSQSFRVSTHIATKIEDFCIRHIDSQMVFKGMDYSSKPDVLSEMYIARTNGSLISKMIELNSKHIKYNTTRKASEIFGLLLTLISLKPGALIKNTQFKYLSQDVTTYYGSRKLMDDFSTVLLYIKNVHSKDKSIQYACNTIIKFGGSLIYKTYDLCAINEQSPTTYNLTLTTAHSSKGLEKDKVTLDADMFPEFLVNDKVRNRMTPTEIDTELFLIYVATSRAKYELLGADWLDSI